jgi:hypothetical protein
MFRTMPDTERTASALTPDNHDVDPAGDFKPPEALEDAAGSARGVTMQLDIRFWRAPLAVEAGG